MPAPATEVSPSKSPNPMAKRMPADSPPQKRSFAETALLGGGALLITASVIKLLLWSENYRDITPIGPILVVMGILGILLAVAVIRFDTLGLALAGALYLAVTTALLLLASRLELLGFEEGSPAPFTARSIVVPIVGMALLGGLAWLISPPQRKPKASKDSADSAADRSLEPSTLIPSPDDGIERLKWPAEREQRMQLVSELPPEPAMVEPEDPVMVEDVVSEPEAVESEEIAPEPATAEVEIEPEPAMEPQEEMEPPHEPTEELAAVIEPVPDSIPEPQRSMLVREHEILEMVTRARGADDPGTLNIRGNIAGYYLATGDVWRAAEMQEAVAADCARILGDTHPHTMTAQVKARHYRKMAKKKRKPKVPVG